MFRIGEFPDALWIFFFLQGSPVFGESRFIAFHGICFNDNGGLAWLLVHASRNNHEEPGFCYICAFPWEGFDALRVTPFMLNILASVGW